MATVDFSDITSNISTDTNYVVTGDGYFDDIMEALNKHIDAQYKLDRLKGTDYATVYLGMVQAALTQAFQFALQKGIAESTEEKNDAQTALIARQTQGFTDDAKQKLLKNALDSWSVAYSVAKDANSIPSAITASSIDTLYADAYNDL